MTMQRFVGAIVGILALFALFTAPAAAQGAPTGKLVDVNKASESELAQLPNMTPETAKAVVAQRPGTDRYFIEYVDYRSADGYFRKYRFIFVDGQILPYHLAIPAKIHSETLIKRVEGALKIFAWIFFHIRMNAAFELPYIFEAFVHEIRRHLFAPDPARAYGNQCLFFERFQGCERLR